jgi:AraC-like DNA-binding protein
MSPTHEGGHASGDEPSKSWAMRTADATQVLAGSILSAESEVLKRELSRFEQGCPSPTAMAECLILRAILLDVFFHLERALADATPATERTSARARLQEAPASETLPVFLDSARQLVAEAERARELPLHERARRWICDHLGDQRTVRELAAQLGAHPRTLSRQFARHVGMTVQEYRWKCRVMRASELLSSTDLKVDAVAEAVGIRSKSTLYRLMRRAGQPTPRRKRRSKTL